MKLYITPYFASRIPRYASKPLISRVTGVQKTPPFDYNTLFSLRKGTYDKMFNKHLFFERYISIVCDLGR
jgi:hypothetical protein